MWPRWCSMSAVNVCFCCCVLSLQGGGQVGRQARSGWADSCGPGGVPSETSFLSALRGGAALDPPCPPHVPSAPTSYHTPAQSLSCRCSVNAHAAQQL
jgi:hypothetical protein